MIRILPRYRAFRMLMERQYRDTERIVLAVSEMCAKDYQRYHGVSADRIRVVYHGTDTDRFSPDRRHKFRDVVRHQLGIAESEVAFIFVGHDFGRKGLRTAVRAVRSLADEGFPVRLLVVGERKLRKRRFRSDDRRDVVLFTGRVTDTVPFYAAADALVLPTFYDPCSLTVGEAMASGLAVVTTRANGASEMLSDGRDGFVLDDPADDVATCDRLRLLLDSELRARMGAAARQTALRYPLDRNCDEIIEIYETVIQRRPQSQRRYISKSGSPELPRTGTLTLARNQHREHIAAIAGTHHSASCKQFSLPPDELLSRK
ncbi:MAG: glycosyltransferase family 4 protein [Planctomycetia bacterium]|nr:glycosyltransferase family 4 protein [Planctomycetia bacterium]